MSYMYDKLNSLQWEINQKVKAIIDEMTEVLPEDLYLDKRSAYRLYVDKEYIAVHKGHDLKALCYYGGFEYVDEEHVTVLGDYIFYSADDERVQGHLDEFFHQEKEES